MESGPSRALLDVRSATPGRGIASAPLTFAWLLVLFVTTRSQRSAGRWGARRIQRKHSTNLSRLNAEPSRVLAASLFWLDDRRWWPYVPVFAGVVAPAERRLHSWRWLLVGLTAHVIATYAGQGYLKYSIERSRAPRHLVNARDVGVSYFVFGVAGALTGYIRRPWRGRCQVGAVTVMAANAIFRPTFTEVGHLTALVIGLAAIPLTRHRDEMPYPNLSYSTVTDLARLRGLSTS